MLRLRSVGLVILVGVFVSLGAPTAIAAEVQQGQTITIGPGQVVNDDLYAFGSNVEVPPSARSTGMSSPRVTRLWSVVR
jgi:hypothetical protein